MNRTQIKNALCAALLLGGLTTAAGAELSAEFPDARQLIEQHIQAIGGRDALLAQTDAVMEGEFSMPAAGVTGRLMMASRSSGERVMMIELPGLGEMRNGYSRELAWSIDPFMGPRLLEGDELAAQAERMEPGAVLRDHEFVASARTIELASFADQDCYRVELQWRSGRVSHDCYAVESGLLIAMESVESSPMGDVQSLSLLGQYEAMHGLLVPTVTRVQVMGQEQIMTVSSISLAAPDDALFELPPPIRTLLADRQSD